jgi:hypothetical protein
MKKHVAKEVKPLIPRPVGRPKGQPKFQITRFVNEAQCRAVDGLLKSMREGKQ